MLLALRHSRTVGTNCLQAVSAGSQDNDHDDDGSEDLDPDFFSASWSAESSSLSSSSSSSSPSSLPLQEDTFHHDDDVTQATPLPLSGEDMRRLSLARSRQAILPLMIMDAMLPQQRLVWATADDKFHQLWRYCQDQQCPIGMLGLSPITQRPLSHGVTVRVQVDRLNLETSSASSSPLPSSSSSMEDTTRVDLGRSPETAENLDHPDPSPTNQADSTASTSSTTNQEKEWIRVTLVGDRRMQVQGEPWLDESGSFYLAEVEVAREDQCLTSEWDEMSRMSLLAAGSTSSSTTSTVRDVVLWDNQEVDQLLSPSQQVAARAMSQQLPTLIEEWKQWVLSTRATDFVGLSRRLADLGPYPDTGSWTAQSLWVAALVNPLPALGVCLEIRPAMLSCSTPYDRMVLATQALQSSIDHLSGRKRLF